MPHPMCASFIHVFEENNTLPRLRVSPKIRSFLRNLAISHILMIIFPRQWYFPHFFAAQVVAEKKAPLSTRSVLSPIGRRPGKPSVVFLI